MRLYSRLNIVRYKRALFTVNSVQNVARLDNVIDLL